MHPQCRAQSALTQTGITYPSLFASNLLDRGRKPAVACCSLSGVSQMNFGAQFRARSVSFAVLLTVLFGMLVFVAPRTILAQEPAGFGPLDPTPPKGITPQEIIAKMGARETVFDQARRNYIFRRSVKVDTIDDDTNKPDGEYY